jgi:2-dehydro-3-deoxyphosphogluconate aldolase/(4S)-4-hydroxy-2-oxoglutarate aldolase
MPVIEKVERVSRAIEKEGLIAHVKLNDTQQMIRAINSLLLGGITILELPIKAPKWQDILKKARTEFGNEITIGISGILDRRSALNAIQAGADYVSSPHTERGIVELCKEEGTICMQGGLTPNEVFRAQQTGADYVNIMPASLFGNAYLETLIFNYGDVPLIPVGGIDEQLAVQLAKTGIRAVVVDSWLVNDQMIARRQFDEIQKRAASLKKAMSKRKSTV